jgi:hypothetical protein
VRKAKLLKNSLIKEKEASNQQLASAATPPPPPPPVAPAPSSSPAPAPAPKNNSKDDLSSIPVRSSENIAEPPAPQSPKPQSNSPAPKPNVGGTLRNPLAAMQGKVAQNIPPKLESTPPPKPTELAAAIKLTPEVGERIILNFKVNVINHECSKLLLNLMIRIKW